uniref:Peptidase n=1 Tax=viral metagenome TaxID=1070528 RepID=A0A6M3JK23_9ZZZZ
MSNLKLGDIVVFKGQGVLYFILSRLLKLFEPSYDFYGWHMAFICSIEDGRPYIAEALVKGVRRNPLDTDRQFRVYRWLGKEPEQWRITAFVNEHEGDRYDILCYVWTFIQRLALKLFNKKLGYLKNDDYTCWEWCAYFAEKMGKPWCDELNFPLLTDFLNQKPTQVL